MIILITVLDNYIKLNLTLIQNTLCFALLKFGVSGFFIEFITQRCGDRLSDLKNQFIIHPVYKVFCEKSPVRGGYL